MSPLLPLFPLGTVALPGVTLPLHVFEDRYRDLVADLLALPDPEDRLFGIVAIREGYEVGEHSARSMFRVGCVMRLQEAQRYPDGRYDVATVGQGRFRVVDTDTTASYVRAEVNPLGEPLGGSAEQVAEAAVAALAAYTGYRARLEELTGSDLAELSPDTDDPTALSYQLSAGSVLPLAEQQELLETPSTLQRLGLLRRTLRSEQTLMRAVPALPATQISRSSWSPN